VTHHTANLLGDESTLAMLSNRFIPDRYPHLAGHEVSRMRRLFRATLTKVDDIRRELRKEEFVILDSLPVGFSQTTQLVRSEIEELFRCQPKMDPRIGPLLMPAFDPP
jgi:hypothetical protein